jgi:metallophosphoesterase superfamily enzyme
LVFADDVNILDRSVHTVTKSTKALVVASEHTGLEVNADKSKYMVMSRDQNVGPSHSTKIDNCSFERVKQFKYLGTILRH